MQSYCVTGHMHCQLGYKMLVTCPHHVSRRYGKISFQVRIHLRLNTHNIKYRPGNTQSLLNNNTRKLCLLRGSRWLIISSTQSYQ